MDISQYKQKFIEEAGTLLVNLDNTLLELEKDPGNLQYVNEAFRVMHTIKGTSGMFGFEGIVEITHELEGLYDIIRENRLPVTPMLIEITFAAADHVRSMLNDEEFTDINNIHRHTSLKANLEKVKKSFALPLTLSASDDKSEINEDSADKKSSWNILFFPNDELIKRAVNLIYTFHDLFILGEYRISNSPIHMDNDQFWSIILVTEKPYDEIESALLFVMDYCKITKIADFNILDPNKMGNRNLSLENLPSVTGIKDLVNDSELYRNGLETTENSNLLNEINAKIKRKETIEPENVVQEIGLPILKKQQFSRISVDASKLDNLMYLVSELVTTKSELILALQKQNVEKATDTAEKIEKLSKLFSEQTLSLRLVSVQEMLHRFKRLIRDLSKQLGKTVEFVTIGEETELDKNIIDNIGEPVMHLIRNCIDHGIETPDKRREKGKPEKGIIKFEAIKSGNYVYINISDDGNGIDTKYIYTKATDKGFIAPGTVLTRKEILDLIFIPGFSTAQSLTNVSGRGVGMDIVLKKIQEIRGEISITSELSVGTTFTLKLQQSIAIIETLLIKAGCFTYAVPVEDIETCILEESDHLIDTKNRQIGYNDNLIPYLNLRDKFSDRGHIEYQDNEKLIVIHRLEKTYAIVVDSIIGEFQAVIKPLGNAFKGLKFLSGASILGDGNIALLLDTDKLWYEIN